MNVTDRDIVRKQHIGYVLQLGIILLCSGLALQIVQQEIIKHREHKSSFNLLQTWWKDTCMKELFISGSSIGAYAKEKLHIEDTRLVNDCHKWVSQSWCAHLRRLLPGVIQVKQGVGAADRVPKWDRWSRCLQVDAACPSSTNALRPCECKLYKCNIKCFTSTVRGHGSPSCSRHSLNPSTYRDIGKKWSPVQWHMRWKGRSLCAWRQHATQK